jgi:hypothetical protein
MIWLPEKRIILPNRETSRSFKHQRGFILPGMFAAAGKPNSGPSDPYYSQNVLLLGYEGADTSTTFTDESPSPRTFTAFGNAQIDTGQFKWGAASGQFDGTGDYISTPATTLFNQSTLSWTMETEVRFNSTAGNQTFMGQWGGSTAPSVHTWIWWYSGGQMRFSYHHLTGAKTFAWSPSTATWYHIMLVRNGANDLMAFVEGTQIGTTQSLAGLSFAASSAVLSIGADSQGSSFLNGWLDETRYTIGTARETSNFTRPSAAHLRS